ncbi:MAG: virulence protein RhuM/Fic/DOC family protein [Patescibacteria group bacterium]|nr:type II toxin-antitoxin system death-on-curing family toxin [Patescibacteria group bacterium]
MHSEKNDQIILYKTKTGQLSIDVKLQDETVWLTQKQMSRLFNVKVPAINKHLKNIFETNELSKKSVISILETTASDSKKYQTNIYNLDAIISVGYRVNSSQATQFRIWATQVLRNHILKGFTINQNRLRKTGLKELEQTLSLIKNTISTKNLTTDEAIGLFKIITDYTESWLLLQKYDENSLTPPAKHQKPLYKLTFNDTLYAIYQLKKNLTASDLFGRQKDQSLEGIIGALYQTFDKKDLYKSIEEKAAHLLYFTIKDHPFTDGNKRIGAMLFITFLAQNKYLLTTTGERKFDNTSLVALTLLVAESNPTQKESIILLIMNFINK